MKALRTVVILAVIWCMIGAGCSRDKKSGERSSESPEAIELRPEDLWPPKLKDVEVDLKQISRKNYIVIFDGSGSMRGNKIAIAKAALKRFVASVPKEANIGLIAFDRGGCAERAPLGAKREAVVSMVDAINASGYTPLGAAFTLAYERLVQQANRQAGYGEYHIVVITDGQATDGNIMPRTVAAILAESPIVIHTIGLQIGSGHALNQPGKIYYTTADNYEELSRGLDAVLAELETFKITSFK